MEPEVSSIIISIITGVVAVIVAVFQSQKAATKTIDQSSLILEHRLTVIEEAIKNAFTSSERQCLIENTLKIKFLFDYFVRDAGKELKNPANIDKALSVLENEGWSGYVSLSDSEKEELRNYVEALLRDKKASYRKRTKARFVLGFNRLEKQLEEASEVACE